MKMKANWTGKGFVSVLALVLSSLFAGGATAELQRVEAMGSYGIRDSLRTRVIARDEAISLARWEGVSRVALELIGEATPGDVDLAGEESPLTGDGRTAEPMLPPIDSLDRPPGEALDPSETSLDNPSEDQVAALQQALGKDVLPYMRSYRILDDRGEVPVFIQDDPDVTLEYVVVVEVLVDVDRVTAALVTAGLIAGSSSAEAGEAIAVELLGLSRFEAVEALVLALREQFGATRVQTVEFSRERQVLLVEGPFGPGALSAKLARLESPQLILEPIGVDSVGRRIRLMGRWFPELEPEEEGIPEGDS